jgi:hypothetical protein
MTKRYEFKFTDYECDDTDDDSLPYPVSSAIDASFDFQGGVTWDVILWQFCKFLESTGYEGVRERIRLIDNFGIMSQNCLFHCIREDDFTMDWSDDDTEEDEEETTTQGEARFQDLKREVE